MNKIFLFLGILGVTLFMGCTNDKPAANAGTTSEPAPATQNSDAPQGYVGKAKEVEKNKYSDLLTINYWVFEKYYHPDKAQKALGKGRWFKFEKDGTFVSGRWEEETAHGVWRLYKRENKDFILLDSSNDKEDAEFDIQGINGDQDQMAWVGSPSYAAYDPVSLVITNLMTIPTKAQFGVVD